MFADNTLTPKEAVRLCALGGVAAGPVCYSALAGAVRHFTARIMGPSLDLMGLSVELLRYEGLVEAIDGTLDKYLNFGEVNSGFIVTPAAPATGRARSPPDPAPGSRSSGVLAWRAACSRLCVRSALLSSP